EGQRHGVSFRSGARVVRERILQGRRQKFFPALRRPGCHVFVIIAAQLLSRFRLGMLSFDAWVSGFSDHLIRLRPSLSSKVAWSIGLQHYDQDIEPEVAAQRYVRGTASISKTTARRSDRAR